MELVPKALREQIPPLYATEEQNDPLVYIKLFIDNWTWYITELAIEDDICFGYVISPFEESGELGYFSLREIKAVKGSLGIGVERDLHFEPKPLSIVKEKF